MDQKALEGCNDGCVLGEGNIKSSPELHPASRLGHVAQWFTPVTDSVISRGLGVVVGSSLSARRVCSSLAYMQRAVLVCNDCPHVFILQSSQATYGNLRRNQKGKEDRERPGGSSAGVTRTVR